MIHICRARFGEGAPALVGPWLYVPKNQRGEWLECKTLTRGKPDSKKIKKLKKNLWIPSQVSLQVCETCRRHLLSCFMHDKAMIILHDPTFNWINAYQRWTRAPHILLHLYTPMGKHMVVSPCAMLYRTGEIRVIVDDILYYDD